VTTKNIVLGLLITAVVIAFIAFVFRQEIFKSNDASISGTFDINGVTEGATITLLQREFKPNTTYQAFAENLPVTDQGTWEFNEAKSGTSYEIQAQLVRSNTVVSQSSPITVTAPATGEVLVINAATDTSSTSGNAVISGNIGVNGYIPQGSTITVEGRAQGETNFTVIAANLPAQDNQFMSYTSAVGGQTYEIQGIMYDANKNEIGSSSVLTVTAPASNEELNINSSAQPPSPTPGSNVTPTAAPQGSQTISGTINYNGQTPPNSRIVLFQRVTGTSSFQVAQNNITPQNGSNWAFTNAVAGTSYDLIAILKQNTNGNDTDISDSNTITVTAPASGEVLNINSSFTLPQAPGPITLNCNSLNSGNQTWPATISFQTVPNAGSYWFQIGSTNGGSDLQNFTQNGVSGVTVQNIQQVLNNDVTYFARYAYSEVPNQGTYSSQFSPFSSSQSLRCP
jgi:hypothetical protein